jgi:hypothetical protein
MKKAISITLSLLMLAAILHLSVGVHYCGGKFIASRVSFSVKPISCGMEDMERDLPLTGTQLGSLLCENQITSYVIDDNYVPTYSSSQNLISNNLQVHPLPLISHLRSIVLFKSSNLYTSTSPPGILLPTDVELSDICIFRI